MSKLADLRAGNRAALPERTYPLCLAQNLVAEAQALEEQRDEAVIAHRRATRPAGESADAESKGRPRRAAERPDPPEIAEINARMEALFDEMREYTGELRLRGKETGAWLRWVGENPPRKILDPDGKVRDNELDQRVTYGNCDADALFATLHEYAVEWDGDPIDDDEWEFILAKAAPGDLQELCRVVVQMHEGRGVNAPPKSLNGSPATATSSTDSSSPETSGSPRSDSSAGSPPSDTSTSTSTAT